MNTGETPWVPIHPLPTASEPFPKLQELDENNARRKAAVQPMVDELKLLNTQLQRTNELLRIIACNTTKQ